MLIQYVLLLLIAFILWQTAARWRAGAVSGREFAVWTAFWLVVAGVVALPGLTSLLAERVGVGRGADLVLYLSMVLVFYLLFRLFVRQNRVERDLSRLVEELALHRAREEEEEEPG